MNTILCGPTPWEQRRVYTMQDGKANLAGAKELKKPGVKTCPGKLDDGRSGQRNLFVVSFKLRNYLKYQNTFTERARGVC